MLSDSDRLTALLLAEAGQFMKNGKLNCTKLAENLIANCVIYPPCKVGDKVYSIKYDWQKAKEVIAPYQITNITITQNKKGVWIKKYRAMQVLNGKTIDHQINFAFDEIDKTVFLTSEEAEKSLNCS